MSLLHHWIRHYGKSQKHYQTSVRHFRQSHLRWARTHYQILGLPSGASQADIKQKYYQLSMQHHPDKDDGSEEKFREITTAYEVLGNPRLRRLYDRGLLSDEQPDASIHYPTESGGGSSGYSDEDREKIKASVKTFDKWAEDHVSEAFHRTRHQREALRMKQGAKIHADSSTTDSKVLIIALVVCIVVFSLLPQFNQKEKSSDDKKKKS